MARTTHRSSPLDTSWLVSHASFIDRLDPRTRIVTAVLFSVGLAAANGRLTLGIALALAALMTAFTRMRPLGVIRRLVPVNVLVLFLILLLPLSTGQSPLMTLGGLEYSREGLLLALTIALKANAIVLWIVVVLGTLDIITLGHALRHLRVPEKLTHLLLFTVRYLDVLYQEYVRLRVAMKTRGFRPRVNAHTYRSYGYLVGMLLVRSLDRSERMMAAMKCRGFRGRFYLLDHFTFSCRDIWCGAAALLVLVLLSFLECS